MGLGSILFLVVAIVALIVFIYLVVMTAKTWGVLHTILLCTLFIECWVFLFLTAAVHDARVPATKAAFQQTLAAERAESETKRLQWGESSFGDAINDAVIPLKGRVKRLTADRGRVWREVLYLQEANQSYVLGLPAPAAPVDDGTGQAPAADAVPASTESLPQGLVLYAFGEQIDADGKPLPDHYLGEFKVASSQAGEVTLTPTRELFPLQQKRIADGLANSWTLYELLPLDSHVAFSAPGSQSTSEEVFGNMDPATIEPLFVDVADDARREAIIQAYINDGKPADTDTLLSNLWVQIQLDKPLTENVDANDSADATERGYFDVTGRSIDSRLKIKGEAGSGEAGSGESASGDVTLTPDGTRGKLIVLKAQAAERLTEGANAVARVVQRSNVRPLNDYEKAFNTIYIRDSVVSAELLRVAEDSAATEAARQNSEQIIVAQQAAIETLSSDLENIKKELTFLTSVNTKEEADLVALRNKLSELYRLVHSKHAQQVALQSSLLTGN